MCLVRKSPAESNISHVAPDTLWAWDIYRVVIIFENSVMSKGSIFLQISSRRLHFADISSCQTAMVPAGMPSIVGVQEMAVVSTSEGRSPCRVMEIFAGKDLCLLTLVSCPSIELGF